MKHIALLAAVALMLAGCLRNGPDTDGLGDLLAERDARIAELQREVDTSRAELTAAQRRADTLAALGGDRLKKLFHVKSIRLGRFTGGYDTDGRPGHDAVKVYLEPLDASGSVIKAAGDVTITLFDLTAEGKQFGVYRFGVDTLGEHWYSGAFTYHFSFVCPFGDRLPAGDEITVRVKFVDYLTGGTFTDQTQCAVQLSPATQPARP